MRASDKGSGFRVQGSESPNIRISKSPNPQSPHPNPLRAPTEGWSGEGTSPDDPAAIIFTTGSTGPPKGVLFSHRNFDAQVDQIREFYDIRPGEIDVPCFPMFGLFNSAMGVTTVIPDMDPSRPARSIR